MSLQALAERTGLTASFLSQVERDVSEPSISSLRRIASALAVPIFEFLGGSDPPQRVIRNGGGRTRELPASGIAYELLVPSDFASHKMAVLITQMAPGGASSDDPATQHGEEFLCVLSDVCTLRISDEVYSLEQGDSIYFHASQPHQVQNQSDAPLKLITAITPRIRRHRYLW